MSARAACARRNPRAAASPAVFGANAYDGMLVMAGAVPAALAVGKPGTPAYRDALRGALDRRARVMVLVQDGGRKVVK